ncbi:MAG: imelysin family protein, partial [Psychroserpens sp.]|nr:imelysin family protein [Psychroserpens sp.]
MMKKIFIPFIAISLVFACSSSDSDSDNGGQDTFNRQAMLSNWADNIIVPAIQGFSSSLDQMVSAKNDFIANPDQTTLTNLRTSWLSAYSNWQYVEIFNIGPAESINYAFQMNIYPTNVQDIQNNIANGNYDLTSVNNNDAVGFPAVDYLLYGIADNDSDILNAFTSDANANGNTQYLSDVIDQMQTLTNTVLTNWTTNYKDVFAANTGNTATSSTNLIANDFIFYYEKGLRANKIGIPAGVFSTTPFSDKVEAFYNQEVSKMLALTALDAVQDFFNGRTYNSNQTAESFKSYLDFLNTIKNGEDLSTLINAQFNEARTKIQA